MANFKDSPHFSTHNDYYTPKIAWEQIVKFIPKNYRIFEAFCLNSNLQSAKYIEELGYEVIADNKLDFLSDELPSKESYEMVLSNPPFQRINSWKKRKDNLKYRCIKKLFELDKPFIILLNSTNIFSKWWKELVKGKESDVRFIFPSKKINYDKYEVGGKRKIQTGKNACSFNSVYITYKMLKNNHWI
tara:strand:- start:515 stop:1078 length:564 start_codon:yes stop_codon:yes gene_type:complete